MKWELVRAGEFRFSIAIAGKVPNPSAATYARTCRDAAARGRVVAVS